MAFDSINVLMLTSFFYCTETWFGFRNIQCVGDSTRVTSEGFWKLVGLMLS